MAKLNHFHLMVAPKRWSLWLLCWILIPIHSFLLAERSTNHLQSRDPYEIFEFTHQLASTWTIWTTGHDRATPGRTSRGTSEFSWTAACSVATVWWKLQHNGSVRCGSGDGGIPWNTMDQQYPATTITTINQNQASPAKINHN